MPETDALGFPLPDEATLALIAYDITLMRPGCVNVAAGLGCNTKFPASFPVESWLVHPTDNMRVYPIRSDEELLALVAKTIEAHPEFASH
jgi:hypothetical protein